MKGSADRVVSPDAFTASEDMWGIEYVQSTEFLCEDCRAVFLVPSGRTPRECPVCRGPHVTPFSEAHW